METPGYISLTRQSGLMREMQVVAQNIANLSTAGYRREGVIFSEYIKNLREEPSLSMARGNTRHLDLRQGGLSQTGGSYDLAIQGEGFFLLATPAGERLTRAGAFSPSSDGNLVNPDGYALLDEGGGPIIVPMGSTAVHIGADGTISANGAPIARIGLWLPSDPLSLRHQAGTVFSASDIEPTGSGRLLQGYLEDSNVAALSEIARMIEVQRSYEQGQKFLDNEDQRQRNLIQTLGK